MKDIKEKQTIFLVATFFSFATLTSCIFSQNGIGCGPYRGTNILGYSNSVVNVKTEVTWNKKGLTLLYVLHNPSLSDYYVPLNVWNLNIVSKKELVKDPTDRLTIPINDARFNWITIVPTTLADNDKNFVYQDRAVAPGFSMFKKVPDFFKISAKSSSKLTIRIPIIVADSILKKILQTKKFRVHQRITVVKAEPNEKNLGLITSNVPPNIINKKKLDLTLGRIEMKKSKDGRTLVWYSTPDNIIERTHIKTFNSLYLSIPNCYTEYKR